MPDLPQLPSGVPALLTDARQFLAAIRFDRPTFLFLVALPAVLRIVAGIANRVRRRTVARLGTDAAILSLVSRPSGPGWLARLAVVLGWSLLAVGAAGPRWGTGGDDGIAVGRDIVIVIDLSRSMLADDMAGPPTRWQVAVAAADELIETLRLRGGHRGAIVVFAAHPKLLVPLTTDYDHLQAKLAELDGPHPPSDIRPSDEARSGTRIGAALTAAVAAHDPRFPGSQDIILLTDGDDPTDDREWATGVTAARTANIPIHVVGLGDPDSARAVPILLDGKFLEFTGPDGIPTPIRSYLHESVTRGIATEARGEYLAARREVPPLSEFFRGTIEPFPSRELTDDALPSPRDRSAWFLALGIGLLLVGGWKEQSR